ncbi:MAG: riboflavin synthase [Candidatus Omnitrophota bacterium]|jgi:riboflavin synthase
MFTGIIKEVGVVRRFERARGFVRRLELESSEVIKDAKIGDSIAVNGICLTLIEKRDKAIAFDVMEETVERSGLSQLKIRDRVNLEGSIRAGEPLGGHFVQGHIDCAGRIVRIKNDCPGESSITVEFPAGYAALVVEKGSVTVDGVSLTVGETGPGNFRVYIIPHTLKMTNLGSKHAGDMVNLEFDILGKYIAKLDELRNKTSITEEYLKRNGF